MLDDPFWRDVVLAVLEDRRAKCSECGEYFADWLDEKGHRREGARAPKRVQRLVRPCGCAMIELDQGRDDLGEKVAGQRVVLVPTDPASPT